MNSSPKSSICHFATVVACATLLAGCGSGQKNDNPTDGTLGTNQRRQQLVNVDNGLMVRKWVVIDQPDRIAAELTAIAEPMDLDETLIERLQRNGFRLLRIPEAALETLDESLGGATQDQSEWLGQSPLWQTLHHVSAHRDGQAVAVDGQVSRYENGTFRLMARAWTMPMEDGPYVQVEVLPQFRVTQTVNYRDLLEGTTTPPHLFPSMAMTLELQPGYAYALVGVPPNATWPGDRDATPRGSGSRNMGGGPPGPGGIGPGTAAPKTLGEVMLISESSPPMRGIMIFVAKIPPELFPVASSPARELAHGE